MADLFDGQLPWTPLASRMRPRGLSEIAGQQHLIGEGRILRTMVERDRLSSMIFWGPPGVGKTTLARVIAGTTKSQFVDFSAVTSGIKEIREVMGRADEGRVYGSRTVVFVDEIHRFNKAQQDAFLPYVERGSIILIGATTENPSFEVNSALLSRCRVFILRQLSTDDIVSLLQRALTDERGLADMAVDASPDALRVVAVYANGDARTALNTLEMAASNTDPTDGRVVLTPESIVEITGRRTLMHDKDGEAHYDLISALHKSMRNSDVQAAVYWLARMLEGGEDPIYVARRVVRFASEDIGLADSRALEVSIAAMNACRLIGMPECAVHLAHAVSYMSLAPKSNAVYKAYNEAAADAATMLAEPVPLAIRNAPTKLMRDAGYGKGYQYAHDAPDKITNLKCLPDSLAGKKYYRPTSQGAEEKIGRLLERIEEWHRRHDDR